jgi:hypothetical protein
LGSFLVLAEAEGSASKLWLNMFGGVKVKSVAQSEAFSDDKDENVDEAVCKEILFLQEEDCGTGDVAFTMLDQLHASHALVTPEGGCLSMEEVTKEVNEDTEQSELMKELFDDSSVSVTS